MNIEEHKKLLNNILELSDNNPKIQNVILDLEQKYVSENTEHEELINERDKLKKERDDYAVLNSRLYLERNETIKENKEENTTIKEENAPRRTFEDLNNNLMSE